MKNRDDNNIAYAHNVANEYTSVAGNGVTHDDAGNLTTDDSGYVYSYDYENRLTEITDGSDTVATFSYDALGRRIEKIEYASGSPSSTTRFYYDSWRVLSETDESDTVQREYIYGNYLDEVLVMVDATDHYYTHDHLFSPAALIGSSGYVDEYYEYDAYGKMVVYTDYGVDETWLTADDTTATASAQGNPIGFTGQRLDNLDSNSLAVMYYKNRFYLVDLGRFAQPDPLGVKDVICLIQYHTTGPPYFRNSFIPNNYDNGSMHFSETPKHLIDFSLRDQYHDGINLYEYVSSNPTMFIDTEGLDKCGNYKLYETCGTCGPDVTASLWRLSNIVQNDWDTWDDDKRKRKCDALYDPSTRKTAWDIRELHKPKDNLPEREGCATGKNCGDTVTVNGACYKSHTVNYFLWGLMNKLCGYSYDRMHFAAEYHKRSKYKDTGDCWDHPSSPEWIIWMRAGYSNNIYSVRSSLSLHEGCKPCTKPPVYMRFTYNWRDDSVERE